MIEKICDSSECTGCGACKAVCPKKCITLEENENGVVLPVIDYDLCIECKRCINTCPNNTPVKKNAPVKCFAGWSKDSETRRTSASGGIASEIYKFCIDKGIVSVGCELIDLADCHLKLLKPGDEFYQFRNSKYVFSCTKDVYEELLPFLKNGEKVIFIGLPCQVAGLKNYLRKDYDNLYTIDIVCHGVAPQKYLRQHIEKHLNGNSKDIQVNFRDPGLRGGTTKYWFSLQKKNKPAFYKKRVYDNDEYQFGYHKALIYRDNCYLCRYAEARRVGDLTISDFSGLGRLAIWNHRETNVSCILVNSEKGMDLLNSISDRLYLEERPIDEALKYEHQLSHPSVAHPRRPVFIEKYRESCNFDWAVRKAVGYDLIKNHYKTILHFEEIKRGISRILPRALKKYIKALMSH